MTRLRWVLYVLCLCFGGQGFAVADDLDAAYAQFETSCLVALQQRGRADYDGLERVDLPVSPYPWEGIFLHYSKGSSDRWGIMVPLEETAPACGLAVGLANTQEAEVLWATVVDDWSLTVKNGFDPKPDKKSSHLFLGVGVGVFPEGAGFEADVTLVFWGLPDNGEIFLTAHVFDRHAWCESFPEECS